MPSPFVIEAGKFIKQQKMTIAFAESATAGRLAAEFSLTENSGDILIGGLVCYDACIKEDILGIEKSFLEEYTPESAEVTKAMAVQLRAFIKSDIQIAVTGLTTPGGSETVQKPVGTIFIHILIGESSIALRKVFEGSPEQIVMQAIDLIEKTITAELKQRSV